jgi:hypothetical protein
MVGAPAGPRGGIRKANFLDQTDVRWLQRPLVCAVILPSLKAKRCGTPGSRCGEDADRVQMMTRCET